MRGYAAVDDAEHTGHDLRAAVEQTKAQRFGNCPQYIHSRQWLPTKPARPPSQRSGKRLEASQRRWIARADTFFLASGYRGAGDDPAFGMDASHRGGDPGFVRVVDEETLIWPDFAGNDHFNTIGSLVMDHRVGMLFVDFSSGSLLQISGRAEIDWAPVPSLWPGAQRLVSVHVEAVSRGREVLFVYAARNGRQAPLCEEIRAYAQNPTTRLHMVFSQPDLIDRHGIDFDSKGRLTATTLSKILPSRACDAYICGPAGFVDHVAGWLEAQGIPPARILSESFG